jgi:hypothetical protein
MKEKIVHSPNVCQDYYVWGIEAGKIFRMENGSYYLKLFV